MGIATGMKELTQNILSSRQQRANRMQELKDEGLALRQASVDMMGELARSRTEAGRVLRQKMAQDNAARASQVDELLDIFESGRRESSVSFRKNMADNRSKTRAAVSKGRADANSLIEGFSQSRKKMAGQLRSYLKQCSGSRRAKVMKLLHDFDEAELAIRTELKEARSAWQATAAGAEGKKKPAEVFRKAAAEPKDLKKASREDKFLFSVNQHQDGISLPAVAGELGVATIALGKIARNLLDQGRIRKEGKLYFAIP